jgi:hypothetical protein
LHIKQGEFVDFRYGMLAFPAGAEQAFAPIYINGAKNTRFFKDYAKYIP